MPFCLFTLSSIFGGGDKATGAAIHQPQKGKNKCTQHTFKSHASVSAQFNGIWQTNTNPFINLYILQNNEKCSQPSKIVYRKKKLQQK
jgi:hypothetical protein